MEGKVKNANIMVTIPEALKDKIEGIAARDCRTRNNLITKVLSDFAESDEAARILSEREQK